MVEGAAKRQLRRKMIKKLVTISQESDSSEYSLEDENEYDREIDFEDEPSYHGDVVKLESNHKNDLDQLVAVIK
jgi:hypothetical protein